MLLAIFVVAMLLSIFVVPLGLPGTFIMIVVAIAADYFAGAGIGWLAIGTALTLAVIAEVLEWTLSARFARKYGGSRRAGWGAIIGGLIGAFAGVPIPVIGSMIGAFAGAFAGALVAEYTHPQSDASTATRVATGALVGKAAATAIKLAIAFSIAFVLTIALVRGSSTEYSTRGPWRVPLCPLEFNNAPPPPPTAGPGRIFFLPVPSCFLPPVPRFLSFQCSMRRPGRWWLLAPNGAMKARENLSM